MSGRAVQEAVNSSPIGFMAGERDDSASSGRSRREQPGGLGLSLRVVGDGVFATYPLPAQGEVVLGRSEKVDVIIEDPSISRRHARLCIGPPLTVEDLGSANGTRLGDRRLSQGEVVEIAAGAVIDMGSVMVMVQPGVVASRPRRLWAHGYFEGRLDDECARGQRGAHPFAVVRVHVEGPLSAAVVEECLGAGLRAMDMIASYGPGDYELLLLEVTPEQGDVVVAGLAAGLAAQGAEVTVGTAFFPRDGRTGETLIAHACAALRGDARSPANGPGKLVIEDPTMRELHRVVDRLARGDVSVLLLGEAGVGKATVAELIHRRSARSDKPFCRLDCGALSRDKLARELFGALDGTPGSDGLLQRAHGGTLFLAEVGDLPVAIQDKLLHAVDLLSARIPTAPRGDGEHPTIVPGRKIKADGAKRGDMRERPAVRLVAASSRNLETEVARGRFRRALLDRLTGISLLVPPLRERGEEIEPLARAFIDRAARHRGVAISPALADEAVALLRRYGWPGNVRELQNVIERAVSLCKSGSITLQHLPVEKLVATLASRALAPWTQVQEEPTVVGTEEDLVGYPSPTPLSPRERGSRK